MYPIEETISYRNLLLQHLYHLCVDVGNVSFAVEAPAGPLCRRERPLLSDLYLVGLQLMYFRIGTNRAMVHVDLYIRLCRLLPYV